MVLALSSKANKLLVKPMVSENMKDQVIVLLSAGTIVNGVLIL